MKSRVQARPGVESEKCDSLNLLERGGYDPMDLRGDADTRGTVIDDFRRGLRDWFQLNLGHLAHQQTWTRKLTDPLWRGPAGAKLIFTLKLPKTNRLSFVVQ